MLTAITAAVLLGTFLAPPANADEQFDPLEIVQEQELIGTPGAAPVATIESSGGESGMESVAITPISESPATDHGGTSVVVEENFGFVTTTGTDGTDASFIVLKDASAPRSYDFEIGGPTTVLTLQEDGSVLVRDHAGTVVNFIAAPWATDAEGADLETHYTVAGNVVTQHVDTAGAVFPVTADPTMGCGTGWCSVYFNRRETVAIAGGGPAVGAAVTAACAKAGAVIAIGCGVSLGVALSLAAVANRDKNCVGILFTPLGSSVFIEPRGTKHCK
ncbi:hypothetical protein [Microbacterium maritypicum]